VALSTIKHLTRLSDINIGQSLRAPNSLNNRRLHNRRDRSEENLRKWPKACPCCFVQHYTPSGADFSFVLRHRAHARRCRCGSLLIGRANACNRLLCSGGAISIACGSSGSPGHSHRHSHIDHDGRGDRLRDPLDDPDPGVNAVFPTNPDQLHQGSSYAMDARRIPRHVLLLHSGASSSSVPALSLRAGCDRNGSNAPCTGLRRMADLFHSPHFERHQRQPYRRSH